MTQQWTMPAWLVLATAVALVLLLVLALIGLRWRARTTRLLTQRAAESAALRSQVEGIERRLGGARPVQARDGRDYVVTVLGHEHDHVPVSEPAPVVAPAVFADIVLRETVVQSASLLHGLRRALSPEVRNRIRFEMGREVKRSRKERRAESREALRQWQAHQRRAHPGEAEESAA